MKWLNPKTGKAYNSVLEALVDYMCPGPCIDCPLNCAPYRDTSHPCLKYVRDNPLQAAKSMGLTQVETPASDMTLTEVQWICNARASEFGTDMCVGCILWGERGEGLPKGCRLMGRCTLPSDWQLDTFITFDPNERVQLRGLKDAFGRNAIIERTANGALILSTPEGIKVELPRKWWEALPPDTAFTMEDVQKNDFAGAVIRPTWHRKELPKRMSSPPLKPDAGKAGEHTDERGMLDPQSYTKRI